MRSSQCCSSKLMSHGAFAETQDIAIEVLNPEVSALPRLILQRLRYLCVSRRKVREERVNVRHINVRVQMIVILPVSSIVNCLRSAFQVDRCSITTHARIDGLVYKVDIEPEFTTVIRDGLFQIVDEELWRNPLKSWSASG